MPRLTAWQSCRGGLQCATLAVPLDWSRPNGERFDLTVARRKMIGAGPRIGSLVFNPGGPAESGLQFLRDIAGSTDRFPKGLNRRFDIVSWDTRGSGSSLPIRCTTTREFEEPDLDPTPDSPAEVAALDAKAHHDASECRTKAGTRFAHVGTASTAQDLEALRQALGDAKLSYVGYSYGTVIGTLYAQRYPTHVRAMVLDGVVIPGGEVIDETHRQAQSFEHNLDAFLADCASRPKCTFGHGNPRGALIKLISDLEHGKRLPGSYSAKDDKGTTHTRTGTFGIGELYPALILPLYSRSTWSALEQGLADATRTTQPDGFRLLSFRDQVAGRQLDGTWDTSSDGRSAIRCEDSSVRATSVIGDQTYVSAWGRELPF
ncbi:MAG: alpha/beta hydrolase, partial [Actinomycetota bacterium]|nr:alpha/beta hydrolase [Actinomycetota bacterium]